MMLFDEVMEEPDQKRKVFRVLNMIQDPDFLLIRICTQEKESYPDKRTRIRNTDLRDSTSEEPSVKCEVLNMKCSNQSYCEERHPNNNFYRHTINNICTRSCSFGCQRRLCRSSRLPKGRAGHTTTLPRQFDHVIRP